MFNILTIDLEDYFQVHAFSDIIKFEDWGNYECRIERNVERILEILSDAGHNSNFKTQNSKLNDSVPSPQHLVAHSFNNSLTQGVKATFFVLGWIAERYPGLVKRIQKEGHEIACHGYAHKLIYTQSKEEFRQDIRKAKAILEDITGCEVIGYRAPSYSITNKSQWAFEALAEEGFKYDSSIFPIRHDFYGMPDAPRFPFIISLNGNSNSEFSMLNCQLNTFQNSKLITQRSDFKPQSSVLKASDVSAPQHGSTASLNNSLTHSLINSKGLIEFPISTVKVLGTNFPISGGGYFRLFPYPIIKRALKSINQKENKPFIFYVHPWEFDPDQPRIKGAANLSKFRHYVNLDKTEFRFEKLLSDFQFSTIRQILIQNS
ncbi:MAG: XrtA system polysaccharide deacetylase [Pseudobdellovibrionaceae bacterium]